MNTSDAFPKRGLRELLLTLYQTINNLLTPNSSIAMLVNPDFDNLSKEILVMSESSAQHRRSRCYEFVYYLPDPGKSAHDQLIGNVVQAMQQRACVKSIIDSRGVTDAFGGFLITVDTEVALLANHWHICLEIILGAVSFNLQMRKKFPRRIACPSG